MEINTADKVEHLCVVYADTIHTRLDGEMILAHLARRDGTFAIRKSKVRRIDEGMISNSSNVGMASIGGSLRMRMGFVIPPCRSSTPSLTVATANMSAPAEYMILAHSTAP